MRCARCHGWVWTLDPEDGAKCLNCGRSPVPLPTRAQLLAAGVYHTEKNKEAEGFRKRGVELATSNGDESILRRFKSR